MQLTARKQRKQSKTELVEPIKLTVSTSDSPSGASMVGHTSVKDDGSRDFALGTGMGCWGYSVRLPSYSKA